MLEQIVALKDEGRFGLLSYRLLFLSAMSSATSFGTITQKEVLQKMKDKKINVFFTSFEDLEKYGGPNQWLYKLCISWKDGSRYSDYKLFRYSEGSWEQLETEFRREAGVLREIGFKINYKGYIE